MAKINTRCRSIAIILAFTAHIKKKKKKKNLLAFIQLSPRTCICSQILSKTRNSHILSNPTSSEPNQNINLDQSKTNTNTQLPPNVKPVPTTMPFFYNYKPETLLLDKSIST